MLYKLTRIVTLSHPGRYKPTFFTRCFNTQNITCFSKKSNLPATHGAKDQVPETFKQVTKTIEAKPTVPDNATRSLEYLQRLSAKNAFLAKYLEIPIDIIKWSQLPKQQKIDSSVRGLGYLSLFIAFFAMLNGAYLYECLKEHEITKRKYFCTIAPDIINKFDEVLLNETMEKYENKFVNSSNSPLLKKVDQVLRKLIESNKDFVEDENFDLEWACSVLDDDKLDLFVIDEMKFIITTKAVLQLCQNEHQLAYVVANALAHFLLKHKREPLSNIRPYNLWTGYKLLYLPGCFALLSGANFFQNISFASFFDKIDHATGRMLYRQYKKMDDVLCYSKTLEEEADRIALQLLARACFDVREVAEVTSTFSKLAEAPASKVSKEEMKKNRYIYKHAFNEEKFLYLKSNLTKFVSFREKCGCTPLK